MFPVPKDWNVMCMRIHVIWFRRRDNNSEININLLYINKFHFQAEEGKI
jgi:hypothetical protein